MRTVEEVRQRLATTWHSQWQSWLEGEGKWPHEVPLKQPTEREAQHNWPAFLSWAHGWQRTPLGGTVLTAPVSWRSMGGQELPTHQSFATPHEVAKALGEPFAKHFAIAQQRFSECVEAWPDLKLPLRAIAGWLADLDERDYRRFVSVVDWLIANPDSGLYLRQLPIAGLDTKWAERHTGPIAKLLGARLDRRGSLAQVAGLRTDEPGKRLRLLDPALRAQMGGMSDLVVRLSELENLDLPIQVALIIENQQTALCCQDLPGAIVLMGGGYAVTELGRMPWLERIPLIYWGDLDTAGFSILSALRSYHPHTVSCLMDEPTLHAFKEFWSDDKGMVATACDRLEPVEQALRQKLLANHWSTQVRLEQERIPWPYAWAAIKAKALLLTD